MKKIQLAEDNSVVDCPKGVVDLMDCKTNCFVSRGGFCFADELKEK